MFKRKKLFITLFALLFFVSACSVLEGKQGNAGLTEATIKWCQVSAKDKNANSSWQLCGATIIDGKEKSDVALSVIFPDDTKIKYSAKNVKAFEAFKARERVQKVIAEQTAKVAPKIAEAILKAVMGR